MNNNLASAIHYALTNTNQTIGSIETLFHIHHTIIRRKVSIIEPLLGENFTLRDIKIQLRIISGNKQHKRKLNDDDEKQLVEIIEQKASEG